MAGQDHAFSRRDFVKAGSVLLAASAAAGASEDPPASVKVPEATLGRTGARVSRLGIGCAYFLRKQVTPDDVRATLHRAWSWASTTWTPRPPTATPRPDSPR